jgi:transposase
MEHERRKSGRKPKPKNTETVEIVHDLSEDEKDCPCCGEQRPEIGEERSEEYHLVPAKFQKHLHLIKKYGACTCADFNRSEAPAVVSVHAPAKIVPGSDFSNGTIAFFMTGKYQDAIPFHRMEKILERYELSVS